MDGFYDQQVPFMVPGVSLGSFLFVLSSLFSYASFPCGFRAWTPWDLSARFAFSLWASFRSPALRSVEGDLWLTGRGSFWTQTWLMILKVAKHSSPGLWLLPALLPCPLLPSSRSILILVSFVFNCRVVSRSQSTSRGLVGWRQVPWLLFSVFKHFTVLFSEIWTSKIKTTKISFPAQVPDDEQFVPDFQSDNCK